MERLDWNVDYEDLVSWLNELNEKLGSTIPKLKDRLSALEEAIEARPATAASAEIVPPSKRPKVAFAYNVPDYIPDNSNSRNTFYKKAAILQGRIPTLEELREYADKLLPGRYYGRKTACVIWVCDPEEAGAILFLASHAGFIKWVHERKSYGRIEIKNRTGGSSDQS